MFYFFRYIIPDATQSLSLTRPPYAPIPSSRFQQFMNVLSLMGGEAPIFPFFGKKEPEELVSKFARLFTSIKKSGIFVPRRTLVSPLSEQKSAEGQHGFLGRFLQA